MSKITAKNLEYAAEPPPFLARLKSAHTSHDGRHEFAIARPRKEKSKEDECEDQPVVVDEITGESLKLADWEERERSKDEQVEDATDKQTTTAAEKRGKPSETLAAIGQKKAKKRHIGKVIGAEDEDDIEVSNRAEDLPSVASPEKTKAIKTNTRGGSKKAKKIKLSFGDED